MCRERGQVIGLQVLDLLLELVTICDLPQLLTNVGTMAVPHSRSVTAYVSRIARGVHSRSV